MHQVSANYTLPTVFNTLKPAASSTVAKSTGAKANATAAASGTNATNGATSTTSGASSLSSTFLNLLAQELQNQDPTAPVDPTQMVGQMISLNQLDQLISINQTLTGSSTSATGSSQQAGAAGSDALSVLGNALTPLTSGAQSNQLPFDPTTMMPLGFGNTAAMAASINSSINAVSAGSSNFDNKNSGGK